MSWTITGTLQNWLAGTQPNYGLLLKRNTEPLNVNGPTPVAKRYAGEPALRPVLEVTYTANAVYLYPPEILRSNGAALRWSPYYSPGGPQFTSYEVHRSATPGFTPSDSTLLATITDVAVTSFTDTAARPSVGFTYKIKTGTAVSNERTVTLPSDGTATMTLQPVAARGVASSLHYYSGYTNCDNAGAEPRIQAGTTATDIYRPVEFFDLRDIPAGAAVSSATLKVWNDTPPSWTPTVEVHRVTRDWEEGTGVGAAACTANGATWWDTKAGTGWSTLGGDFDSTVEASKVKTAGGDPVWDSFTVTSLVQKWVNTDAPNFGVLLKVSNETLTAGHTFSYASDDYSEAVALRPQLTVSWADGSHAVAPTVSVSGPAPGTQVSGTGVTVSAAASDDRRVESVAFLLDDGSIGSDSTPPFSITWNSTTATNGAHTLKARATDDAGNVTTSAGSAITVSNYAAPTTGITLPTNGSTVRGTTTVTATASAAAGLTVSRVEFYVDGVQFAEKTSSPYSVQWNTLDPAVPSYDNDPATPHVLTTVVVDSSGQDVTSADVTVNVDNRQSSLYKATLATDADAFPPTVVYDPAGSLQLTYPIDVTITNNSSVTWSATDISLRYRWYNPQAPALASGTDPNVTDGPQNALGQSLAPGGSMTKTLNVSPPTLPDGVSRSTYRLQIDLFQISTSSWFAAKGNQPKENPVIINKKLMADALGLERYYQYVGADLGAGMQQLTNVANGNSVIRWTPFTSKGRGLSTVVNLTYNSLEDHSRSPAGNNVSLSISSLIPFGSQLDIHPNKSDVKGGRNAKYVEFVDGDGTPHHFDFVAGDVYAEPPGVHLYLRKKNPTGDQTWAITRPDRATFYFRDDGFPTSVVDKNGNTLAFTLQQTPPGQDPGGPKFRITQVTDAGGRAFSISYYSKNEFKKAHVRGKVSKVTDHEGHVLEFTYFKDGNLLRLTQKGGTNADGSFLPDRTFVFTYMDSQVLDPAIPTRADRDNPDPNTAPQSSVIFSVRDPRGNESTFRYCFTSGTYLCPNASNHAHDAKNKGKLKYRYNRPGESILNTPKTQFDYDIDVRRTTATAPLSRVTTYDYDTDGKVTSITDALNRVTSLTWSTDFQVTVLDEPGDPKTTFAYNDNGYLTQRSVLTDRQGQTDIFSTTTLEYQNIAADAADVSGNWRTGPSLI